MNTQQPVIQISCTHMIYIIQKYQGKMSIFCLNFLIHLVCLYCFEGRKNFPSCNKGNVTVSLSQVKCTILGNVLYEQTAFP